MSSSRFALVPREGLFLKDGRGWYTSETGRGHGHSWPLPSTVLGALRAAWGQRHQERHGHLPPEQWPALVEGVRLTRLLALRRPAGAPFQPAHRLWPAPADALHVRQDKTFHASPLLPRPPRPGLSTLGAGDTPGLESLWLPCSSTREKPARAPLFWTEAELVAWLRAPSALPVRGHTPPRRQEVHLALNPDTLAAEPSRLFTSEVVETLEREPEDTGGPRYEEWALAVECELPAPARDFPWGPVGLGGRRRLAHVEHLEDTSLFSAPELPGGAPGLRLILATPAEFSRGWLPDGLRPELEHGKTVWVGLVPGVREEVVLRAALVPRPLHLSTWDMARRRPRPTRRLVPAGATYFFHKRGGGPFSAEELRQAWLAPWGPPGPEALGLVLPGLWNLNPSGGSGA
jgi:CRISPR-associated protein Cmr3